VRGVADVLPGERPSCELSRVERPGASKAARASDWNERCTPELSNRETSNRKEPRMNWIEIEGKWVELKGQARTRWAKLTDDDLKFVEGHFDKLVGKVVERYGIAKEQARAEVNVWADRLGGRIDPSSRSADRRVENTTEASKTSGPR
jgi:uncharacterized protein YjbJ (UPF0337 family)